MAIMKKYYYYKIIIKFLEKTFGELVEVTFYYLNKDKWELAYKSSNCKYELNTSLPAQYKKILDKYLKTENEKLEFLTNFPGKDSNGTLCRISTFFIKNNGNLTGMFNIKININEMIIAANFLNTLLKEITSGEERNLTEESIEVEKLDTIEEYSYYIIDNYFEKIKKPIDILSVQEKIKIIHDLDKKGIFQLKGSIAELAKKLNTSEKTIYRYLKDNES